MTSPTEHAAPELAAEAGTPLPDSPPVTAAAEELLAAPDEQPRSRKRVRSLEPSTPQPEDAHRDPLGTIPYVHTHAHKRNRLEPIGDEEDAPKDASPPGSPPLPAELLLASSPRYESNVRRMNRGVSKLNVRERESSSRTRRKRQGSGDRDNRSSGSGSPRAEEDEAMDATDPAIFMDATDAAAAVASGACVPSSTAAAEHDAPSTSRARSSSPPPKKRRSMDVSPTDTDTAPIVDPAPPVTPPEPTTDLHVDEDIEIDKASPEPEPAQPAEHEAETAAAPASGSDVTDAPVESEAAQPKDAEPITLTIDAPIPFPPIAVTPPALLAPAPIIVGGESHKRPRSEEPEPIGRPRSPPPPVPSTMSPSLKSPFAGFASFATNPLKAKAADPPLWASPSASPFGGAKLAENKPPSLAGWGSPSPKSIFASPSPSFSTTLTPRFMSNFSYKTNLGSPSPFGPPLSPAPTPKADMPAMNVRSVPGGGFGAFSATSGFARFGSQRPTSPPGAVAPENSKTKIKENGSAAPRSDDDSSTDEETPSDKEPAVSFGDRLKTESGATIETDDEDKLPISRQESMETGEEGEMTIHSQRAKLFAMEGSSWKERGTGTLKLNVGIDDKTSARLVMRADGVYRVILNEKLFYGMSFSVTESTRTMTFGGAPVDGKVPMYTLRFPSAKVAVEIRDKVKDLVPSNKSAEAPANADDLV